LIWLIGSLLSLVTIIAVWFSVSAGKKIGGYTRPELVTYYIMAFFLDRFTLWIPFYNIVDEIRNGGIVLTVLPKPFSYFWQKLATETGWHLVTLMIGFVVTAILIFFLRDFFIFHFSPANFLLIILTVLLAIFVIFTMSLCLGLLAFWFTEVYAVDSLFWAARTILAGRAVPLSFIPVGIFQTITRILPFRYMFSFPLEIYFEKLSKTEIIQGMMMQFFWIGALILVYKFMWNRGRRAYTAFGS
jgi:ABC-2 type transport system permease protein